MTPEERLVELSAGLRRMAWEAEVQAPGRSALSPLLMDMSRRAAAHNDRTAESWLALSEAFWGIEHGLDTAEIALPKQPIPRQRPRPNPPKRRPA